MNHHKKTILVCILFTLLLSCTTPSGSNDNDDPDSPPTNLILPFSVGDITLFQRLISPYGVVRRSQDRPEFGHSGIDIPLNENSPIYAVADGVIVEISDSSKNGKDIKVLLGHDSIKDSGWVFIYESIVLNEGIQVESTLSQGDNFAKAATQITSNHLQLSWWEDTFLKNHTCWPNQLEENQKSTWTTKFATLKGSTDFTNNWNSAVDEGQFPLKELLNTSNFPDGPQYCYTQGTDVRTN